jgi:hypothetical protein
VEWCIHEKVEGRGIFQGGGEEDAHGKKEIRKMMSRGGEQEHEKIGGRYEKKRSVREWRREE